MKKLLTALLSLGLLAALVHPAHALEYGIDAPAGANYGKATSIAVPRTPDGGAAKNEDVSKNAALIPPEFGSPTSNLPGSGLPLTPDLAPGYQAAGTVPAGGVAAQLPPDAGAVFAPGASEVTASTSPNSLPVSAAGYTEITSDLYYAAGHLGTLNIPAIGLTVKVYQGTDSAALAKGAGHFSDTSIWNGTVALAGHNRGVTNHFGQIHTLNVGDQMTLTTKLGARTYAVTSVEKVEETDRSGLAASGENRLVLYTCVRDQRAWRWCVTASEIV